MAMQDRDRATTDAECSREEAEQLDVALKRATAELEHERQRAADLQRVRGEQAATIGRLEGKAADARLVPGLREAVQTGEAHAAQLSADLAATQVRGWESERERVSSARSHARTRVQGELRDTRARLEASEAWVAALQGEARELGAAHSQLQSRHDAAVAQHASQAAELQARVACCAPPCHTPAPC